jgi:translation initiation factor 1A
MVEEETKENEFGDFEEVVEEEKEKKNPGVGKPKPKLQGWQKKRAEAQEGPVRVRMPRDKEVIGVILQRYGGNRMEVHSTDGKIRNCRVPGRYKRRLWLRPGDAVIIVPWEDDDSKGDVIFKYQKNGLHQLKKKGVLDFAKDDF